MKIANYKDIEPTLFDNGPAKGVAGRVLIGKREGAENFCMRLFELEKDGHTPRHSHEWEHEIFFHSGQGELFFDGSWIEVSSGTAVLIPGQKEHQIKNRGEAPLIFVCLIPSGVPEL